MGWQIKSVDQKTTPSMTLPLLLEDAATDAPGTSQISSFPRVKIQIVLQNFAESSNYSLKSFPGTYRVPFRSCRSSVWSQLQLVR